MTEQSFRSQMAFMLKIYGYKIDDGMDEADRKRAEELAKQEQKEAA